MRGSGNVKFLSPLGLAFIALKLAGVVDWSWWWVLAPFWAPWALYVVVRAAIAAWRYA